MLASPDTLFVLWKSTHTTTGDLDILNPRAEHQRESPPLLPAWQSIPYALDAVRVHFQG